MTIIKIIDTIIIILNETGEYFLKVELIHKKKNDVLFTYRVAGLVINDNKLLVAKRVDHPVYYIIGGGVEINETSEEAIIREIMEETGLKLNIAKLAYIQERFLKVNEIKHHEIVFFYLMEVKTDIKITNNTFTDQGFKETLHWLPLGQLKKYNIVPDFLKHKSLKNIGGIEHIISKEY